MEVCDTGSASNCFPNRPYHRQPYDLSPAAAAAAAAAVVASATAVGGVVPNVGLRFAYPGYSIPSSQYTAPYQVQPTNNSPYGTETTNHSPHYKEHFIDSRKPFGQYESLHGVENNQRGYSARSISDTNDYSQYVNHYNAKSMTYPVVTSPSVAVSGMPISHATAVSNPTKAIQSINESQRGHCSPWTQIRPMVTSAGDSGKNLSADHGVGGMRKAVDTMRFTSIPSQIPSATGADILLHHATSLSQWDVNDPKLPKIRQFDTFTMWPQGHCRFAYQKSASEGARRHASGWAMRNTNNHNAQILKKSCLGVLLCTNEGCPLAMRPAICDKARRRQEGRPCCMPNCNGRIYNQPCRGHGGYPVTHFWREHGDTVYFQSKGTHDHIRPDLKPVRDTAARRRRQIQLEKLQQTRSLTSSAESNVRSSECLSTRGNSRTREVTRMAGLVRKRAAERVESKVNDMPLGGKLHQSETNWASSVDQGKIARTTLGTDKPTSPTSLCTKPEPIFPSSPALGSYSVTSHTGQNPLHYQVSHGFDPTRDHQHPHLFTASVPTTTSHSNTHYPMNGMYAVSRFPPHLFCPRVENSSATQTENVPTSTTLTTSFMKDLLYEDELRKPDSKTTYPVYTDPPSISVKAPLVQNILQLSQHQPIQHTIMAGPNSESTSGGLNASWSTPSPPTGGSSSLFGASDIRNVVTAATGVDECEPKDKMNVNSQTWRVDSSCYQAPVPGPTHLTSPTRIPPGGYGFSTPTHPAYGIQPLSALESPDNLVAPSSLLMSSSTPLSNGSILASRFAHHLTQTGGSYPTGYITPIPFYSNRSDSRSTRASSSSGEATSQESGSIV
ncbi:unnamed protein product [Echinostoma caproni]|uniref:GCM domain-containing protein n=1 Tax=Echinostoma caproni TaxID=27848 RepID=A0A183ARQ4_9TREM|nr:unnamed protein product [Echinostoma caproni]